MATIALVAVANSITAGAGFAATSATAVAWAGVASAVGAYVDSTVLVPSLLGDREGGNVGSAGVQSVDEGGPERFGVGPETRIPGYLAWQPKELEVQEGSSQGKGGPSTPRFEYFSSGLWLFTRVPEGVDPIHSIDQLWLDSKVRFKRGGTQNRNVSTGYEIVRTDFTYPNGSVRELYTEIIGLTPFPPTGDENDYYFDEFVVSQDVTIGQSREVPFGEFGQFSRNNDGTFKVSAVGRKSDGRPFLRYKNLQSISANPAHDPAPGSPAVGLVIAQFITSNDANLAVAFIQRKGSRTHTVPSQIEDVEGVGASPAYQSYSSFLIERLQLFDFGNRLPNLEALVSHDAEPVPLGEVIERILVNYCGLSPAEVDVAAIPDTITVRGYWWVAPYDGQRVLQPLLLAYDILWFEADGKVRFVPRTLALEVTIPESDLGVHQQNRDTDNPSIQVLDETEFRRINSCNVRFTDPESDYQIGDMPFRRPDLPEGESQSVDLTKLTITKEQAREIAKRVVWQSALFRQEVEFTVGPKWLSLTAGTYVNIATETRDWRILITDVTRGADGRMICQGYHDSGIIEEMPQLPADVSGAAGNIGFAYTPPETISMIIDCAPLELSHGDQPSVYFAGCATFGGADWRGGIFMTKNVTQTQHTAFGSMTTEGILGRLLEPIPTGSINLLSEPSAGVLVEVYHGLLNSTSEEFVLSNFNQLFLGTGEVIGFQNAEIVQAIPENTSTGIWRISGLFLRGLRGTEDRVQEQAAFTPFAFMRTQFFRRRVLATSELDQPLSLLSVPTGGDQEDFEPFETLAVQGRTGKPFPVAHLAGVAESDSQGAFSWVLGASFIVGDKTRVGASLTVYECIADHIATADDRPTDGINADTYWVLSDAAAVRITWNRRSRLFIPLLPVGTPPSSEPNELYRLEIYRGENGALVRTVDPLTSPEYVYSFSQREADSNTGSFRARVYQLGEYSRGLPSDAILPNNL